MTDIGQLIKKVFEQSGMSIAEFSRRINVSRTNVYNIFSKADIGVQQLQLISEALNHDFLAELSKQSDFSYTADLKRIREERELREQRRQKASAYLSQKRRTPYYNVVLRTELNDAVSRLFALPQTTIEQLRRAILGKDEADPLDLYDWGEVTSDLDWAFGDVCGVVSIDFTPIYVYEFKVGYCKRPEEPLAVMPFLVPLSDEQYIQLLLLHLEDRDFTPQRLMRVNKPLYDAIVYNIPWWIDQAGYSILFFMTEVQADIDQLLGERDIEPEVVFSHDGEHPYSILAELKQGVFYLRFVGDDTDYEGYYDSDCDADTVKRELRCRSIRQVINLLRERYATPDLIDVFDKLVGQ